MAAVLACGPGALLSHLWAAWNYGLRRLPHGPVQVLAPRSRHARPGIEVHTSRSLTESDYDNHGIPTTSPARTVLDCAPRLPAKALRRLVNDAQIQRLTTAQALREIVARSPGRATRTLRSTRSGFESDHDKRLHLEAQKVRVVAVTYEQVTAGYPRTRSRLGRIIAASPARASSAAPAPRALR